MTTTKSVGGHRRPTLGMGLHCVVKGGRMPRSAQITSPPQSSTTCTPSRQRHFPLILPPPQRAAMAPTAAHGAQAAGWTDLWQYQIRHPILRLRLRRTLVGSKRVSRHLEVSGLLFALRVFREDLSLSLAQAEFGHFSPRAVVYRRNLPFGVQLVP